MFPKAVPAGRSFVSVRVSMAGSASGKNRLSPATGATSPDQLSLSLQLFIAPPPSQVRVTGVIRHSSDSRVSRAVRLGLRPGRADSDRIQRLQKNELMAAFSRSRKRRVATHR